jgi:hypothetical protein
MKKISLFILMFWLFQYCISAQSDFLPGYIIKNNGDSIRGFLHLASAKCNAKKCLFKLNKRASTQKFTPSEILFYAIDNISCYKSCDILIKGKIKRVFLEFAVKGRMNLFIYSGRPQETRYFVNKKDSNFCELENTTNVEYNQGNWNIRVNNEFRTTLARFLYDCPPILPLISNSKLAINDLIKLSAKYHYLVCPAEQCVIYTRSAKSLQISFGPMLTFYTSLLNQSPVTDFVRKAPILSDGVFMDISNFDFLNPRFSSYSELTFLPVNYTLNGTSYSMSQIRFTEVLRYSFTLNKLRPIIGFGPRFYIHLNSKQKESYLGFPPETSPIQVGICGQFGVEYLISERFKIMFNTRYEYCPHFAGQADERSELKNISLQMGIGFRIK